MNKVIKNNNKHKTIQQTIQQTQNKKQTHKQQIQFHNSFLL
jgi:hypothetical protein